jgi:chloride channel protein, CIC family
MPYRDDLAHEAVLPSLISSTVAYPALTVLIGAEPSSNSR